MAEKEKRKVNVRCMDEMEREYTFVDETKRVYGLDEEKRHGLIPNFRNVGPSQNGKCSNMSRIEGV